MNDATPTDDAELLRRYAESRDEAAFAELVRRYLGLVYHAALRQMGGDAHAAEDVAQRVFALLAQKAPALRNHATLAGWLHTTTRLTASEARRTERRRRAREQEAFIMHGNTTTSPRSSNDAAWFDLRPVIDEALGELDAPDRDAVLLRYFADLPHAQIGARLAISENAARMRVERALEKLHTRLTRRGVTSTASALGVVLANHAGAASMALPAGMAASVTSAALASSAATAAGVAGSAVAIFGFMSTAKIATGLAVVVGVAGLGSVFYERKHANRAEAALAALRHETEELRGQAARNEALARAADARAQVSDARIAAALQKETVHARAVPAAAPSGAAFAASPAPRPLADDAPTQKEKARLHHRYDPFLLQQRGLTPAQAERFVELMLQRARAREDVQAAVEQAGMKGDDPGVMALRRKHDEPIQRELRDMLGPDGMAAYSDYESTSAYRMGFIEPMRPVFLAASVPLSSAQEEKFIRIIMANVTTYRGKPTDLGSRRRFDWNAIQSQAYAVLAPAQQPLLKAQIDRWSSSMR